MRHTRFEISNFKGIRHASIDLMAHPRGRIFTLVGLNESGKTTVLEAINSIASKSEMLNPLELPGTAIADAHDLIPIAQRSNFNEEISIKTTIAMDSVDNDELRTYLWNVHGFNLTKRVQAFTMEQRYEFENSKLKSGSGRYWWGISLIGKVRGARTERTLEVGDAWYATMKHIMSLLPSIMYFPNFLFEFPERIYLEAGTNDPPKYEHYRVVLQDVLDSIGERATLQTHVVERAKSDAKADKQALESVLLKMSASLTEHIFVNWNRIFKRSQGNKEIVVDCDKDDAGRLFMRLRIRDGRDLYSLTERSLGFRWFFTFLLFTVYRGFRTRESRNVLFLLDEPASNLHPSAQTQLLQSFGKLPETFALVYTTHSHHLINPDWLENTYVVANEGMRYDHGEDYTAQNTLVTLEPYRSFAARHPDQTTYYQPILDVLSYSPTRLDNIPDVTMIEGKNDYYTLKYLRQLIGGPDLNLLPGNGAGSLADVIRLYLGWGRRFVVLLDSDSEGSAQKKRYLEMFGEIAAGMVFTLADINALWAGKSMEKILSKAERIGIQASSYPEDTAFSKVHFNRAVQELFLTKREYSLSTETREAFAEIFAFCAARLWHSRV